MGKTKKTLTSAVVLLALVAGVNYALAYRHMRAAIDSDPRNEGITALAYQQ